VALQDLLFKKVLNLFFEVFPSFFHVSVVDITYTKIQSQLWLYNNYYYYNYHYLFTYISLLSLISNYNGMELVVHATAHRLKYILKAPPESCDWGQSCPLTLLFPAVCSRGKLRTFVSSVFYFKIAVIFNHFYN
jgi:hypothetical protein